MANHIYKFLEFWTNPNFQLRKLSLRGVWCEKWSCGGCSYELISRPWGFWQGLFQLKLMLRDWTSTPRSQDKSSQRDWGRNWLRPRGSKVTWNPQCYTHCNRNRIYFRDKLLSVKEFRDSSWLHCRAPGISKLSLEFNSHWKFNLVCFIEYYCFQNAVLGVMWETKYECHGPAL